MSMEVINQWVNHSNGNASINNGIKYLYPNCRPNDIPYLYTRNARIFYYCVSMLTVAMATITVTLNGLFLVTMFINRRLQTTSKQILMLLAFSDFLYGSVMLPIYAFHMLEKYFRRVPCQLHNICSILGLTLGILSVTTIFTIILEQYLAILHPFWYERHVKTRRLLIPNVSIFVLTTIIGSISRYILSRKIYLFFRAFQVIFTGILLLLMIYLYANVVSAARKTQRRIVNVVSNHAVVKSNTRAIKTSFFVFATFIVCYIPITIHSLYISMHQNTPFLRSYVIIVVEMIAMSNAMLDPFVYYWRLKILRKATKRLLESCSPLQGVQGDLETSIERKLTMISATSRESRDNFGTFHIGNPRTQSGSSMPWEEDTKSQEGFPKEDNNLWYQNDVKYVTQMIDIFAHIDHRYFYTLPQFFK